MSLAKNVTLQLGALVTLYVSITALITLIFSTVNIAIPDPAAGSYDYTSNQQALRMSLSLLIVFFPTYLYLTRRVNSIRRLAAANYPRVTTWLIYLSLLVGGIIMMVDLVVTINTFLNGELTLRFILKALSLLVIVACAFWYYLRDARGHWQANVQYSIMYGVATTVFVIGVMAASLYHLQLPTEARGRALDEQQINDLQTIQNYLENYQMQHEALPTTLEELFVADTLPTAPPERMAYTYNVTSTSTYELCAEFAYPTSQADSLVRPMVADPSFMTYSWDHEAGKWCFKRTMIDTSRTKPTGAL